MAALGTRYADGEVICRQGEEDGHLYVVQSGRVEVGIAVAGDQVSIGELGAGEIVGVMALFGGQPHYATVRAKGEARVLALDKRQLLARLSSDRPFALRLLERLGKRVHALVEENADLKYGDETHDTPTLVRPPTPPTNPMSRAAPKTRNLRRGLVQRLADSAPGWPPPAPDAAAAPAANATPAADAAVTPVAAPAADAAAVPTPVEAPRRAAGRAPLATTPPGRTLDRVTAAGDIGHGVSLAPELDLDRTAIVDAQESTVWKTVETSAQSGSLADRRLHASYRVARAVAAAVQLEDVLDRVLEALFDVFAEAKRGFIVLADGPDDNALRCAAVRRRDEDSDEGLTVSTTIVHHAMNEQQAILSVDAASDQRFSRQQSVIHHGIRSMMCAPLVLQDSVLGVIHIDTGRTGGLVARFSEDDLALLASVATQVAMAISNARLHQERVAEQRLVAVGQTVAGLAHCIKNVLNGIRGGSFILDRGLEGEDLGAVSRGWATVKRNNDFLSELVLDMLSLSKDRAPAFSEVDPNQLCREVCELVKPKAAQAHIEVVFQPDDEIGLVQVDAAGIRRCLLNLIGNAVDACAELEPGEADRGEPGREVVVRTARLGNGDEFEVAVADNGPGMPDEVKRSLFQMFFSTKGNRGTGLGLAVSKKIIEEHAGDIGVDSKVGEGTTFRIHLPARPRAPSLDRVESA